MPIQHQQFTAYEGVASGPQVMLAYEISLQALQKRPERAQRLSPVSSPGLEVGGLKAQLTPRELSEQLAESVMNHRS